MITHHVTSQFRARQDRLRALMDSRRVPFILVSHLPNIRYLTGFTGSAGVALLGPRTGFLWVDPRYTLQAQNEADGVAVIEEKKGILKGAARWLLKNRVRELGFEPAALTWAQFEQLRQEADDRLELKPAGDLIEELRIVKDRDEIETIRAAGKMTAEVFAEVVPLVRPGVKETDLAAELEFRMRKHGAQGAAFETIVAAGPRSAYPHARPSSNLLPECGLVIFDLGVILSGYAADMTRTIFLGEPTRRARRLYSAVLQAQEVALRTVRDSATAGEVDLSARRTLAKHRLARFFTHSTGHGVGLEIHERPRLAKGETTGLRAGSVVTVEPGIYLEGWGGIRIEDTVSVSTGSPEILTPAAKELWALM